MKKLGTIEVEQHPIPDRWVIGMLQEYGSIPVYATKLDTGRYCVTVGGNVMDGETGEFKDWRTMQDSDFYPTLYAAFEAFKKFYL